MNQSEYRRLTALIRARRWAAVATQGAQGPEASWVAYAPAADLSHFLLHISRLARHTGNLLQDPRACLAISEPERADGDPQQLARVMLQGRVELIPRDAADYPAAARRYQEWLPDSIPLFEFSDFLLFRLQPTQARFVAGFGRAYTLDGQDLIEKP